MAYLFFMNTPKRHAVSEPPESDRGPEVPVPKPTIEQDRERLWQIIRWSGFSTNCFASEIGLKRAENLYQIQRGNNGISRELAYLIVRRFPQISPGWLLMGEATMLAYDARDGHRITVQETLSMTGEQLRRIARNTDKLLKQLDTLARRLEDAEKEDGDLL